MGTLNACYVRASEEALRVVASLEPGRALRREEGLPFVEIAFGADEHRPPVELLRTSSATLRTDAIWLSFQSAVDAFQFQHWRGGKCLRELVYGAFEEERTWERVSGVAEAWEAEALFPRSALESELASGGEGEQVLRVWALRELRAGEVLPAVDARESARAVALHYGLPGWEATTDAASPWFLD